MLNVKFYPSQTSNWFAIAFNRFLFSNNLANEWWPFTQFTRAELIWETAGHSIRLALKTDSHAFALTLEPRISHSHDRLYNEQLITSEIVL